MVPNSQICHASKLNVCRLSFKGNYQIYLGTESGENDNTNTSRLACDKKKENSRLGDIVWMWFQILKFVMLANVWPSFRRIN